MSDQSQRAEPSEEEIWADLERQEASKTEANEHQFAENRESDNDTPVDEAAATAADQQEVDLWANAPPDLRAAHDAQVRALEAATTEHARRSIEGRIASYTRRLQERNEAASRQPDPAQDEEAADPLAELAAEYPEIAEPLLKEIAPIKETLSQFAAIEQRRQEAADAQMDGELRANEDLLEQRHPGWDGFLKEYGPAFGAWIVDQPLYLRQAFVTNQEAIIDPYAAIDTLDAFKAFVDQNTQPPQAQPAAQQQRLNPRRAAQLAGSASPHQGGSRPTVSGIPEDGDQEQIWKAWAAVDPDEQKYRRA
jgi:hypothetical protein